MQSMMNPYTLPSRALALLATIFVAGSFATAEPTGRGSHKLQAEAGKEAEASNKNIPPGLRTPIIDRRLEKMRKLIVHGIENGQITPGEASSLHHDLQRIERREKAIKGDENVTRRERLALHRDINELHEQIWKKTHNGAKPDKPLVE